MGIRFGARLVALLGIGLVALAACSSDKSSQPGTGSLKFCSSDADCPAGEGCESENGANASDAYCSPLCSGDLECPPQNRCEDPTADTHPDCDEIGDHVGGKGVCDQYDGARGPSSCQG